MIRGRCTACSSQIWQTVLSPTASLRRSRNRPQSNACCLFPHAQIHDVAEEFSSQFFAELLTFPISARSSCENGGCFSFPPYRSSLHLLFLSASTHGVGSNKLLVIVIAFTSTSKERSSRLIPRERSTHSDRFQGEIVFLLWLLNRRLAFLRRRTASHHSPTRPLLL